MSEREQLEQAITALEGQRAIRCEYVGDYATSEAYCEQALLLTQEMADRRSQGASLVSLSLLPHLMIDHEVACAYAQTALPILQALDDRQFVASALTFLGHALPEVDRPPEAATANQRGLGFAPGIAPGLPGYGTPGRPGSCRVGAGRPRSGPGLH